MLLAMILALSAQEPSRVLQPHATITDAAFITPDGKLLVTRGSPDESVKVWLVDTGKLLQTLAGKARSVAMGPDGTSVAVGGAEVTTVWDPATGALRQTIATGATPNLAFSRDGKSLTTISPRYSGVTFSGFTVSVWDLKTGQSLKSFVIAVNKDIYCRAISPGAGRLAIARDDRSVRIWDVESEKETAILMGHEDRVTALAFSPDGATLVTASFDKSVRIWDAASGKERKRLGDGYEKGPQLSFSPDGNTLAILGDKEVELWDLKAGTRSSASYRTPSTGVFLPECVEISADGRTLLAGGSFIAKDAPKDRKTTGPVYFLLKGIVKAIALLENRPVRGIPPGDGAPRAVRIESPPCASGSRSSRTPSPGEAAVARSERRSARPSRAGAAPSSSSKRSGPATRA